MNLHDVTAVASVGAYVRELIAHEDEAEERRQHGGVTLEEATRLRAYQLWERAGHPPGDGVPFWLEAEAELTAD